jgi:hypothetical protein
LVIENPLLQAREPAEFEQAIQECVKDLRKEILKFREGAFGRAFRKWGPFSLGGIFTVAAVLKPHLAIAVAGARCFVDGLKVLGVFEEQKVTKRGEMVKLLASVRNDIINESSVKRFLIA